CPFHVDLHVLQDFQRLDDLNRVIGCKQGMQCLGLLKIKFNQLKVVLLAEHPDQRGFQYHSNRYASFFSSEQEVKHGNC
ncbi:hypothetical protein, partial [Sphaerochaeta sp.]|uniref:hypothetical protein n=1 Tax=Sphaerochaeta sp. TaxID=1972642 RepID=UPI002A365802